MGCDEKKILVNGITLDGIALAGGNLVPLLSKINTWQSLGFRVSVFSNVQLKNRIDSLKMIEEYEFIECKYSKMVSNRIAFIGESLKRNLFALPFLRKLKGNYDVIYSISSVLDLILLPWALKSIDEKIKFVAVFDNKVSLEGSGPFLIRFLAWVFYQFSLFFLKKADKIFTVSRELEKYLIAKGFEGGKIEVVGNGLQVKLITEAQKSDQYNVDALFMGRICSAKGIYDALEVLSIVKKTYPDFQFAVMGVGDIDEERRFKKRVKEMNLLNNVRFMGYQMGVEKFTILKSSKCFWFLSESESFGQSLLEAVSCGIPAIAYDLRSYGGIYVNDEVFVVKKNDVRAVAKKVLEIFRDNNFENSAGRLLAEKFSWEKIARKELQLIMGAG